jgi:hypothetical protein
MIFDPTVPYAHTLVHFPCRFLQRTTKQNLDKLTQEAKQNM